MLSAQILQGVDESRARHADVEEHDVDRNPAQQTKELDCARRLADDTDARVFADYAAQSFSHDRMIVRDCYSNHDCSRASGTRSFTVVPRPGVPVMVNSPPQASARSRMPTTPRDLVPSTQRGDAPIPLSVTSRVSREAVRSRRIVTRVALA